MPITQFNRQPNNRSEIFRGPIDHPAGGGGTFFIENIGGDLTGQYLTDLAPEVNRVIVRLEVFRATVVVGTNGFAVPCIYNRRIDQPKLGYCHWTPTASPGATAFNHTWEINLNGAGGQVNDAHPSSGFISQMPDFDEPLGPNMKADLTPAANSNAQTRAFAQPLNGLGALIMLADGFLTNQWSGVVSVEIYPS